MRGEKGGQRLKQGLAHSVPPAAVGCAQARLMARILPCLQKAAQRLLLNAPHCARIKAEAAEEGVQQRGRKYQVANAYRRGNAT